MIINFFCRCLKYVASSPIKHINQQFCFCKAQLASPTHVYIQIRLCDISGRLYVPYLKMFWNLVADLIPCQLPIYINFSIFPEIQNQLKIHSKLLCSISDNKNLMLYSVSRVESVDCFVSYPKVYQHFVTEPSLKGNMNGITSVLRGTKMCS